MRPLNSLTQVPPGRFGTRRGDAVSAVSFWLALVFSILAGGRVQADDLKDVTAASDSLRTIISQALAEEDSGLLASIFTENGAVISSDGRMVRGRLTLKTSAALLFMTMGGGKIEISRNSINLIDSTAYETGRFVFRRPGDDAAWQGSYTAVWQREAGLWKIAVAMGLR